MEFDSDGYPIAEVYVCLRGKERILKVMFCELCGKSHIHGGGTVDDGPVEQFVGHRVEHCLDVDRESRRKQLENAVKSGVRNSVGLPEHDNGYMLKLCKGFQCSECGKGTMMHVEGLDWKCSACSAEAVPNPLIVSNKDGWYD